MKLPESFRRALQAANASLDQWEKGRPATREQVVKFLKEKGYDVEGKSDDEIASIVDQPPTLPPTTGK